MARIKKVYIVSGLDRADGNTPLCDWRLLSTKQFKDYMKLVEWDSEVIFKIDLTGTSIKVDTVDGDNYYGTDDKTKLKDLSITAYRIGENHKRLDTVVQCPWETSNRFNRDEHRVQTTY